MTPLEELTGFGELLGHRVVTLHPAVHGGILARRDVPDDLADLEAHGIAPIDLVCVNLYPFERTIGRLDVALGRGDRADRRRRPGAAARRREEPRRTSSRSAGPRTTSRVLEELRVSADVSLETRRDARRARVPTTAALRRRRRGLARPRRGLSPRRIVPVFDRVLELSYGENPHQRAAYYAAARRAHARARARRAAAGQAALVQQPRRPLGRAAARARARGRRGVIVKHANPCGVAMRGDDRGGVRARARRRSRLGVSAASSWSTGRSAPSSERALAEQFVEVLFAPGYDEVAARGARRPRDDARARRQRAARVRHDRARPAARARRAARPGP